MRPWLKIVLFPLVLITLMILGGFGFDLFVSNNWQALVFIGPMMVMTIAIFLFLYVPGCWWALRIVTGGLFLAYLWYVIHSFANRVSDTDLMSPVLGFLAIGIPSLLVTIGGPWLAKLLRLNDERDN